MTRKVKWGRSDEGYVESKCGRFTISPLYMGTTYINAYHLTDHGPNRNGFSQSMHDTQRQCKDWAQEIIDRGIKP